MKAHLRSSDEHLVEGKSLVAACGQNISKAYFAMAADTSGVTGRTIQALKEANTLLLCRKCMVAPLPGRYVYLCCEAQEAKDGDATEG